MSQRLEFGQAKPVGERVDASVLEQGETFVVGLGDGWVVFDWRVLGVAEALGEVVAVVEVLEEGACCVEVFVGKIDTSVLEHA